MLVRKKEDTTARQGSRDWPQSDFASILLLDSERRNVLSKSQNVKSGNIFVVLD